MDTATLYIILGIIVIVLTVIIIVKTIKMKKNNREDDLSDYTPADNYNEDFKSNGYNKAADYSDPKEYPFVKRALKIQKVSLIIFIVIISVIVGLSVWLNIWIDSKFVTSNEDTLIRQIVMLLIISPLAFIQSRIMIKSWTCPHCKKELPRQRSYKGGASGIMVVGKCPHCGKDLSDVDLNDK